MNEIQKTFEVWAKSHGRLDLSPSLKVECDGLLVTYKDWTTEIAWRAWANKPEISLPKDLERIEVLEEICADSYLVIGHLAADADRFEDSNVQKAMDNASSCELMHDDVIPFNLEPKKKKNWNKKEIAKVSLCVIVVVASLLNAHFQFLH